MQTKSHPKFNRNNQKFNPINLNAWFNRLKNKGITKQMISEERKRLEKKWGIDRVNDNAIVWNLLNKLLFDNLKLSNLQELQEINYNMAIFFNEEGRDPPSPLLHEASKLELAYLKKSGIEKVKICASHDSCNYCKKNEGHIYTIGKALKEMPIPNKSCQHHLNNGKYPFCRCFYVSVIEGLS